MKMICRSVMIFVFVGLFFISGLTFISEPVNANQPPVAAFTYSPENPLVDEAVVFDASSSYDPDDFIVDYAWDFGDGSSGHDASWMIVHAYSKTGQYNVTLTVTDNATNTDSTSKVLTIRSLAKLFVTIPGINDHGKEMLARAKIMFNYDNECQGNISERDNLSDEQVRQIVINAAGKAGKKGKDVIVNIDMDLENFRWWEYLLPVSRWQRSIRWAGRIANIVSEAFKEEVPQGVRIIYAHSAGVDAASWSIRLAQPDMMYDDLILLNGRTNAHSLRRFLANCGYEWWQAKVFTSKGDLPASPWSLSNYDAAKREAGKAWVHLHSLNITEHSGLRDSIGRTGEFEVTHLMKNEVALVEVMMIRDWRLY